MSINKILQLPQYRFAGGSYTTIAGNKYGILTTAAKNWSGFPVRASDKNTLPVCHTIDQMAQGLVDGATGVPVYDEAGWEAAFVFRKPPRWYAEQYTPIRKPKQCLMWALNNAGPAAAATALATQIDDKKVLVSNYQGAIDSSLCWSNLPPSGYSVITETYTSAGTPTNADLYYRQMESTHWRAGEVLYLSGFLIEYPIGNLHAIETDAFSNYISTKIFTTFAAQVQADWIATNSRYERIQRVIIPCVSDSGDPVTRALIQANVLPGVEAELAAMAAAAGDTVLESTLYYTDAGFDASIQSLVENYLTSFYGF